MLDLETTQAKLVAENDVLQMENARLKYLNQFRASIVGGRNEEL